MTYEERRIKVCQNCNIRLACAYIGRGLEDKCSYLQDIMQGWEYGEEDTLNSLWKDAQGDDLPEIDREVIALQGRKVVFAHRPNPNGWDGKSLDSGKVEHFEPKTYDKGGWNMPDVKYWLDAPLPEGIK